MDEEQLGHISVPELDVLFLESRANTRTLLGDNGPLLGGGFARSHGANEFSELDGHAARADDGQLRPLFKPRTGIAEQLLQ